MKTYSAKQSEVQKKWYLIDAEGLILGRMASDHRRPSSGQAQADVHPARRLRR